MTSSQEGYAVGSIGILSGVIMRYVGSRWFLVRTVDENLSSVSLRSATRSTQKKAGLSADLESLYHDISGVRAKVTSPISCPLYDVTTHPTSSDTWAVGLCGANPALP